MRTEDLPGTELVAAAMEQLGAENAPQLADALGMTSRNEDRTVRRWIDGLNDPSFRATLRLLVAVGLLPQELPERWRSEVPREAPPERQPADDDVAAAIRSLERRLNVEVIPRLDALARARTTGERERREV